MDRSRDPAFHVARQLRQAILQLHRRLRAEGSDVGLPLSQLALLGHLHRRGPMTPGELAAADHLQPQSVTRVLAALERARLTSRQRADADGRRFQIAITDRGSEALAEHIDRWDAWLAGTLERELSPMEQEVVRLAVPLLERLAACGRGSR